MKSQIYCASLALTLVSQACGEASSPPPESPASYFSAMRTLTVEVAYEPGAEPFVDRIVARPPQPATLYEGRLPWELMRTNLASLFEGRAHTVTVEVPTTLEEMTQLPRSGRDTWDTDAIESLAKRTRRHTPTAEDGGLVVIFVNGIYEKDGEPRGDVLGVNVAGTPFVAIFKQVVLSTVFWPVTEGAPCEPPPCNQPSLFELLAEQLVVVHESAHALGLVDNGVPLSSPHRDHAHGRHCANPRCVMYFQNEDFRATAEAITALTLATGGPIWFGPECLQDARLFTP